MRSLVRPGPVGDGVPHLSIRPADRERFKSWSYFDDRGMRRPRVLMASGFGYGNVGDEAQLGACISRWRKAAPDASITLFSPNPAYTAALHRERVEWAPRVAWFRSNSMGPYFDDPAFPRYFSGLRWRLEWSARMARADLPLSLTTPREARVLQLVQEHDVLHISGGGYLTGKTRSRLWDFCLLMRMCQLLGKPYFLTGHNIGVFQNGRDRRVTRMGLSQAFWIGLRDRGLSEKEIGEIGIAGPHVLSSCDDALFCDRLDSGAIRERIASAGADPEKPWVVVNFHHWGQPDHERQANETRFAGLCDRLRDVHGLQPVFIAMTPSDVEPERSVLARMKGPGVLLPYSPDYRVVRGAIADAALVFTMKHHPIVFAQGEAVPVVSVALDDYYLRKNVGAMENTGHARFVADAGGFRSPKVEELIADALGEGEVIRGEMESWARQMSAIELDPYRAAMRRLGIDGRESSC